MASYQRALTLEGGSGAAQQQIQWVEDRVTARAKPVTAPPGTLQRYAGRYQERTITVRNGRLYYRRGSNPESPLRPMAQDLFEVEANPALRVRFVGAAAGPAAKLIEVDSEGTIDESVRSK
jgi:hypothetical protein